MNEIAQVREQLERRLKESGFAPDSAAASANVANDDFAQGVSSRVCSPTSLGSLATREMGRRPVADAPDAAAARGCSTVAGRKFPCIPRV